jgi:putative transposase
MKKARFTREHIIRILQEVVAGRPIRELCRHRGDTETASYCWPHRYASLQLSDANVSSRSSARKPHHRDGCRLGPEPLTDSLALVDLRELASCSRSGWGFLAEAADS